MPSCMENGAVIISRWIYYHSDNKPAVMQQIPLINGAEMAKCYTDDTAFCTTSISQRLIITDHIIPITITYV